MTLKKVLTINGAERMFLCDVKTDTLADVIRRLGLTGTKIGCGTGQCGACTVILDGKTVRSCTKKMKNIDDYSEVITIEGIGTAENLHPLQLAWIIHGGVQCGFCSPGFIMSAYGLLMTNESPTREEVRAWFKKNMNACRCTGYKQLVDAVMTAAKIIRGELTKEEVEWKMPKDEHIYSTHIPRPAALAKVLGLCDYGDDIALKMPDVLYLAVVMPGVSHANIKGIDFEEAEKAPGVAKVITHKDVQGINRVTYPVGDLRSKTSGFERPILNDTKVFRYGDVVALVAADTPAHARAAAKLVKLDLEILPEYLNGLDAMADGAIEVHPGSPNVFLENPVLKGADTRDVLEKSKYVVEGSFYSSRQPHLVIEPEVAQAYVDDEGILTIHCKSLFLQINIGVLSKGLGYDPAKMRIIENPTGASFGYSFSPCTCGLVAAATLATGRPVSLTLNYEEYMHYTGKRSASHSNARLGCDENGKLTGIEYEIAFDKGAYSEVGSLIVQKGQRFFGAPYAIPNVMGLSKAHFSNHAFSTAYRGFGTPQCYTASEQLIDMLAESAGIDPLEMRYRNVCRPGDTSINGHTYDVYPMADLIDSLRPKYEAAKALAAKETTPEMKHGVGVAIGHFNVTGGPNDHSEIALELNPDNTVTVFDTWEDQGQGADVGTLVHTYEAMRPLGLTVDQIKLVLNDTKLCPTTGPASGSRSHYMAGNAIMDGADKLLGAMKKADGSYRSYDEMQEEEIPVKYLGVYDTSFCTTGLDPNTGQGNPTPEYTYGIFVSHVEVEVATGKTKVVSMECIADIGTVGNYLAVDGQAYGGMMHSIGFALSEEYSDVKKHKSMIGAGFPYIDVIPDDDKFTVDYNITKRPSGPHGSSGCSEMFQSGGHVAVINAIYDAVGVRIFELPATPQKVKAGIEGLAAGKNVNETQRYYLGSDFFETIDDIKANPVFDQ